MVPSKLINHEPGRAESIFEKAGFDIIRKLEADSSLLKEITDTTGHELLPFIESSFTIFIIADLYPWSNSNTQLNQEFNGKNLRIVERGPALRRQLLEYYKTDALENLLLWWTEEQKDALMITKKIGYSLTTEILEEVSNRKNKMRVPDHLKLITRFSGFNTNGEVCKVSYEGKTAILRMFRPGREIYLHNELEVLKLSSMVDGIPQLLDKKENWVLTSFFENSETLTNKRNRFGYLPLSSVKRSFEICREIYHHGIALLDFIPANVLVNHKKKVQLIDFEWIHRMTSSESFESGPVIEGVDKGTQYMTPNGPRKSYSTDWEPLTGCTYRELMNTPIAYLEFRNMIKGTVHNTRSRGSIVKKKLFERLGFHYS